METLVGQLQIRNSCSFKKLLKCSKKVMRAAGSIYMVALQPNLQ